MAEKKNEEVFEETAVETEETQETQETIEETLETETIEKEKYDELYDKYLRTLAEYENYKKRTQKEKDEMYGLGIMQAVSDLLPVLDNLDRALEALEETEKTQFSDGVQMVSKQFIEILTKMGVTEIEAIEKPFDPEKHNAVMHVDDETVGENIVVEQFMKGYQYKDKVIRYSMVKVAN